MKITIAPEAVVDWTVAVEYVSERNPAAAARLHTRIHATIEKLADREFEGSEQTLRGGGARVRAEDLPNPNAVPQEPSQP